MYNLKKRFTDSKYTERIFKGTRCKYLHNRPISFFDFTLQTHSPLPIFMIWRLLILEIEPFAFDSFYGSAILQFRLVPHYSEHRAVQLGYTQGYQTFPLLKFNSSYVRVHRNEIFYPYFLLRTRHLWVTLMKGLQLSLLAKPFLACSYKA